MCGKRCCCGPNANCCSEANAHDRPGWSGGARGGTGRAPRHDAGPVGKAPGRVGPGPGLAGRAAGVTPGRPAPEVHRGSPRHRRRTGGRAHTRTPGVPSPAARRPSGYPSGLEADPGAPAVLFALGDPARGGGSSPGGHRGDPLGHPLRAAGGIGAGRRPGLRRCRRGVRPGRRHRRGRPCRCGPWHRNVGGTSRGRGRHRPRSGLSVLQPRALGEVAASGVVFSESSLGTAARPGVFPARNRIIAALSDVVVVVESHRRGGSLYTAEAAARRSIPVCAVPGSVRSPASTGTNGLLVDGCVPVRDATDVLVAVSLARAGRGDGGRAEGEVPAPTAVRRERKPDVEALGLSTTERTVLGSIDDTPTAFETILIRTDLSLATAAQACDRLVERGIVREGAGWWSKC